MKKLLVVFAAASLCCGAAFGQGKKRTPEEQFARQDKNGDKKLSLDEMIGKKTADKADSAKKRFKAMDKDNDGFITLDEFKAAQGKAKRKG